MEVWDDCMCFPDLPVKVMRHKSCRIRYRNQDWEEESMLLHGDLSELLQHEYDHLDGVLANNERSANMPFLPDAQILINALDEYYRESVSAEKPAITQQPLEKIITDLKLALYSREGGLSGERLSEFIRDYLRTTTRLHHPGYMSHQVAVPHYAGALAALVDTFTNNVMAIYEMGPGAASIEYHVINVLLEKIGWEPAPPNLKDVPYSQAYAGGVLTHGGSLTNLTALIAARTKLVPDVWDGGIPRDLAILAPVESHYSIARAAGILGIGRNGIYTLDVDETGAIIPDKLTLVYDRMRAGGRRAIALVANACSTAVGVYDPLDEIGDFCNEHDIWFHVDGAHGASALFSKKHRTLMKGKDACIYQTEEQCQSSRAVSTSRYQN